MSQDGGENSGGREHWSGSLGFILAAAGSAIGLGNIWKFPYIVGENGGGAFVLVYLVCILIIGLPVMLCEITIGRRTQLNPVGAFRKLMPKRSASAHLIGAGVILTGIILLFCQSYGWGVVFCLLGIAIFYFSWAVVGGMGVLAGFVILSFYSVVAGWTLGYIVKSANGNLDMQPEVQSIEQLTQVLAGHAPTVTKEEKWSLVKEGVVQGKFSGEQVQNLDIRVTGLTEKQKNEVLARAAKLTPYSTMLGELSRDKLAGFADDQFGESAGDAIRKMPAEEFAKDNATILTAVVKSQGITKDRVIQQLVQAYGGMETVVNDEGEKHEEYPKKLMTSISGSKFVGFITSPKWAISCHLVFMLICAAIVIMGVKGGIENASKVLMPALFLLLIILIIRGVTLKGSSAGIDFLLNPKLDKLTAKGVLIALGHAFFTLSLGMGAMITYGSYLGKKENLFTSALSIVGLDTLIAMMAGLAIFPAVFAMGANPGAGPGLVFVTLPHVFSSMPGGMIWNIIFFLLLAIAAITSGISLLEVVTAYFVDEMKWSRGLATVVFSGVIFLMGIPAALSCDGGIMGWNGMTTLEWICNDVFTMKASCFFDVMDNLASNWLLPLGGLFISIFVGWVWGTKHAVDEIRDGSHNFADVHLISLLAGLKDDKSHNSEVHVLTLASLWGVFIRFISPVAVLIAFLNAIGWLKL